MGVKKAPMSTNLAIDDQLIQAAQKLGQHRTKREAVNAALDEYVKRRRQQDILTLFGKIEYKQDYNFKKERRARRK
jgi:Arc/MetJ family transcription regulator